MQGDIPYCGANGVLDWVNNFVIDDDIILVAEDGGYFDEYASRPIAYRMQGKCWVNNHAHVLKARAGHDQDFLFYSLVHKNIVPFLASGTRSKLNKSEMWRIPITGPTSEREQHAIAEALSDVDGLIEALEALIAKKRAIKQASMQQILTGKTRLPGFSEEWETKQLGNHVRFLRHGTHSRAELAAEGPVKYVHYGDIHTFNGVVLDPSMTPLPALVRDRARSIERLENGDLVLIDASEDLAKSVEIKVSQGEEVVAGLHTIAARFDKLVLADGFKAYLQFCPAFRDNLRRLAAGTKVYATSRTHVASVEMRLPAVDEQVAIAAVLSDMDAEITSLEARLAKTRAIKQGMMQQLLTGRIRLVEPGVSSAA
jgi:type I restriction enzyme S subunit